jgi:ribosomal protein S18 acetylase RimI-like enzyme
MAAIDVTSGLRLRPYAGEADLPAIVAIENAEYEADGLSERESLDHLRTHFSYPNDNFNPPRDVTLAEVDGRPVGVAYRNWVATTDGLHEYRCDGSVHPDWRRRGIGTRLLQENLERSRALAQEHARSAAAGSWAGQVFGSWSGDTQLGDAALLRNAGFEAVRWFFEMVRPNLEDVPDLPLPDGLEVRPITRELAKRFWDADIESFRDHWGGFDGSDVQFERWMASPNNDLSLWVAAFDGDEVAGGVLNRINPEQNAALGILRGTLASVFTRRPWRRRGVAHALIARSLVLLRERGMTSADLGVDADNPSGALGLYEGLGFQVDSRSTAWRKELLP